MNTIYFIGILLTFAMNIKASFLQKLSHATPTIMHLGQPTALKGNYVNLPKKGALPTEENFKNSPVQRLLEKLGLRHKLVKNNSDFAIVYKTITEDIQPQIGVKDIQQNDVPTLDANDLALVSHITTMLKETHKKSGGKISEQEKINNTILLYRIVTHPLYKSLKQLEQFRKCILGYNTPKTELFRVTTDITYKLDIIKIFSENIREAIESDIDHGLSKAEYITLHTDPKEIAEED